MNRWWNGNHKVLEDNSPLIDGLLPALDTMNCLLNEEEKVARKNMNSEMENELLKKGTFGTVMLGRWVKSNT